MKELGSRGQSRFWCLISPPLGSCMWPFGFLNKIRLKSWENSTLISWKTQRFKNKKGGQMTRLKTSAELKKEETAIVDNLVQDKPGTITISCGIRKLTRLKLVGQKVVDVRSQLSQPLKIHDTFQTLVN